MPCLRTHSWQQLRSKYASNPPVATHFRLWHTTLEPACPCNTSPCYTEKAPNAWQRRGTPKKNKKHLQSTQLAQPTNLTDQGPSTTERTRTHLRVTHSALLRPWTRECGRNVVAMLKYAGLTTLGPSRHSQLPKQACQHRFATSFGTTHGVAYASCKCMPLRHVNTDVLVSALCVLSALVRKHVW